MQFDPISTFRSSPTWRSELSKEEFKCALHHAPLTLQHDYHEHPLFTLSALQHAAEEAASRPGDFYYDVGASKFTDKWSTYDPQFSIAQVFENITSLNAWIILKHVERTAGYAEILDVWAAYIRDLAGEEAASLLINPEMLVIISSPNKTTPYHFDAEIGFLVQISGTKDVWVCDPDDRAITTELEIENYYGGDQGAGMYKAIAAERATHIMLEPGNAVHLPSHGAHWVKNHDNISISLNLNFEFPREYRKDIYSCNKILRKIGLNPRPPGRNAILDRSKVAALKVLKTFRSTGH